MRLFERKVNLFGKEKSKKKIIVINNAVCKTLSKFVEKIGTMFGYKKKTLELGL